ncbi:sulfuric ester hydrolase [Aureococcus anophagefferens]|uniref:Sulfuric ester hydrolase n=1 Tax=Aureococcus anophagefferens TaxID=44056 RepID=A0ABR1GFW9_AURAN
MSAVEAPRVEEKAARVSVTANEGGAPDIVHIVLDDIGMNDLWHSSDLPASVMTNIKALQEGGAELSNYYGQSFCTPRARAHAATDEAGVYSTTLITRESVARVKGMANTPSPTHAYASYHGVHDDYGVNDTQSEVPPAVMLAINEATTMVRRKNFAVGMYFADERRGGAARALATHSTDYVIVLHADNGGSPCGSHCDSNNHPYRGTKFYDFEGAVKLPPPSTRAPRARAGTSYNGLMHHVDWLATFATGLAGVAITDDTVDSLDHWKAIHARQLQRLRGRDTVAFSLGATEATLRFQQRGA